MGDDTKYAVIWPDAEARLSQRTLLNDGSGFHFLTELWYGGRYTVGAPSVFHTLFVHKNLNLIKIDWDNGDEI